MFSTWDTMAGSRYQGLTVSYKIDLGSFIRYVTDKFQIKPSLETILHTSRKYLALFILLCKGLAPIKTASPHDDKHKFYHGAFNTIVIDVLSNIRSKFFSSETNPRPILTDWIENDGMGDRVRYYPLLTYLLSTHDCANHGQIPLLDSQFGVVNLSLLYQTGAHGFKMSSAKDEKDKWWREEDLYQ